MGRGELITPYAGARPQGAGTCVAIPTIRVTMPGYSRYSACQNYKYMAKPLPGWQFSHFDIRSVVVDESSEGYWAHDLTLRENGTYDATEDCFSFETFVTSDGSKQGGHAYPYWSNRCPWYIEYDAYFDWEDVFAYYTTLDIVAVFVRDPTHLLIHDDRASGSNLLVYDDRPGGTGLLVADY